MPKLTQGRASAATATLWCSEMPGFGLRVHDSGRRVYVVRYRTLTGRQRLLTLGRADVLAADQARGQAREVLAAVARGEDPAAARHAVRAAPTVGELYELVKQVHLQAVKPASRRVYEVQWRTRILPAWRARSVRDITRDDVLLLVSRVREVSPVSANVTLAAVKRALQIAVDREWLESSPAAGVRAKRLPGRETVLTIAELARVDRAISDLLLAGRLSQPQADLFRLLALTGCRRNEVMLARRDWVDLGRRLLLLPDSKTGPRRVVLPARAVAMIEAMPPSEWLIPGAAPGRPMSCPMPAWRRVLARAGLPASIRLHDLRHSFGSHAHQAGQSQRAIADMLGHADLATAARYIHGVADDGRAPVDVVADRVASGWQT